RRQGVDEIGSPQSTGRLGPNRELLNLDRDLTYGLFEHLGAQEKLSDRDRDRRRRQERLLAGADKFVYSLDQGVGHCCQGDLLSVGGERVLALHSNPVRRGSIVSRAVTR